MRLIVAIVFVLNALILSGQHVKEGIILDSLGQPIPFVHIQNLSGDIATISNKDGKFKLSATNGDSLWISCVSYEPLGLIVTRDFLLEDYWEIRMEEAVIVLDELVVHEYPTEEQFKKMILDYQLKDTSFIIPGVEQYATLSNKLLEEKLIKSPLFAISHPVSFLYYNLSKKEKEKRKVHQLQNNSHKRVSIEQKFNRDIINQLTGLTGDKLTTFIVFCDFDDEYLLKALQYDINLAILDKYEEFKKLYG